MDDESKPNEEMPETPDEKVIDEKSKELDSETENEAEEVEESEEKEQVQEEVKKGPKKEEIKEKPQGKPGKTEGKKEAKKEEPKKKIEHGPDFRYIVRIANTDINGEKKLVHGLTRVKGIGLRMSTIVADTAGIDRNVLIGDLKDEQIEKIKDVISNLNKTAPEWMLNHRRDYETGENFHFVSTDIDIKLRDEINIMKKIKSYRGVRHEMGLPVRGQRTKAHGRIGLALGVSRKAAKAAAAASSSDKDKGEKKKE